MNTAELAELADQPPRDEEILLDVPESEGHLTMPEQPENVSEGRLEALEPVPDDPSPVLPSQVSAVIRTVVPYVLAGIIWLLAKAGINTPLPEGSDVFLTTVIGTLYYLLARVLEKRWPNIPWLGSTKQPLYTKTAAFAPLASTGYVWWRGGRFTPAFRDSLASVDAEVPGFTLTQGGFNGTSVSASAGTHAGDAADFSVRGKTREQVEAFIKAHRERGNFASFRTTKVAKWGTRAQGFNSYHVHVVPNGWASPSAAAKRQIDYTTSRGVKHGYRNGRDGLASNGVDAGPGHVSDYRRRTWWGYKAAPPASAAPASARPARVAVDGKLGTQTVTALQHDLRTRYGASGLRGPLVVDGKLGTQTYAALQRVIQYRMPKAWAKWSIDGVFNKWWVRRLQWYVGAKLDGVWGSQTTRKLQEKLNSKNGF